MWEDRDLRKYTVPQIPVSGGGASMAYGNRAYDQTEDLHAWSIYRQNLNADLSESAIGINKSSNSERPFGNFQLKETTVNNILNHPKYGPRIKNHDPYTYLRFGLPRVKASQSEFGSPYGESNLGGPTVISRQRYVGQGMTSDSASASEEEFEPRNTRRKQTRRMWKSDPDLLRTQTETAFIEKEANNQKHHSKSSQALNTQYFPNGKTMSEIDLKYGANGLTSSKVNPLPFPESANGGFNNVPKNPHLIVRNLYFEVDRTSKARRFCGAQRQKLRVLDNVSFEVRAGEILALMTTCPNEGTSILNILSNRFNSFRSRMKAEIILNGVYMSPQKMSEVVGYVSQDTTLCPQMSARQTLLFSTLVQKPAKRNSFDTKKRTNAVLEELSLSEVRHTSVADLTEAERRRLLIAMSLLLDTDILLLDQPTKGMDIFDSFFLIEYLRQWALISGRAVIITIHPSTYEIFTMLSRICLISTGRVLFFGRRKDLLPYFSNIDFPCPAFKNPSDYYLDLVTLDNLSSEAMLESSQRIENLVELYQRRFANSVSLPRPPSITPPPIRKANFALQFLALWIRALIFTFPYNVIRFCRNIFISLCLSILCGVIYWHIRGGREQEHYWDRIGFYHVLLAVLPLPLFLTEISDVHYEKQYVLNEIKIGLYSKSAYIFSKLLYSLPQATLVFLAFSLPVSSMAGLQQNLIVYLILMLGYLHTIRIIALCSAWLMTKKSTAAICFGFIFALIVLASGTSIHYKDMSIVTRWLYFASPIRWTHEALIHWEFSSNSSVIANPNLPAFVCSHNPIVQAENALLIRADCGFQSRANILKWFNYKDSSLDSLLRSVTNPFIAFGITFASFIVISVLSFCLLARRKHIRKET
ncbi:ATP-binding cassette sub-family G member 8-like protein [Leptotrombidium deliense]|uniref:ATP-binding cassette sub-family G member 8-like protein n=1 Tax=Leptotrombidium deliense TaxID=299467 RepID=A0A443SKW8_9ACAR|nr:ATP-binding cassette sub-family G member 8-like protein [Leptotrombidium deliense]